MNIWIIGKNSITSNINSIQTSSPKKEDFYSHLNMKDTADADYAHTKRVSKDFKIKNLGEYDDLYVQSNALLLADAYVS